MKKLILFSTLFAAAFTVNAGITLTDQGKTAYSIQLPEKADKLEITAAQDLRDYIKKSTGAELKIASGQPGGKIILKRNPEFAVEEYEVRIAGRDLILSGGGARGVSHAVYAFLENQLGIRWFTWFGDEKVPAHKKVYLDFPAYRKKPYFPVRWAIIESLPKGAKHTDFFRRNAGGRIIPEHMKGFVGLCHTLFWYLPPKKAFMNNPENWKWKEEKYYFKTNPEFYSLSAEGKRVDSLQLCLSNMKMREEFKKRFSERVEQRKRVGIYSFSAMDWPGRFCYCKNCIALEKKYKCKGGPLFDFLLDMAAFAKKKYPKIYVSTLAYRKEQTEAPPAIDKLPDNVIIVFAPIDDNFSKDLDHRDNAGKIMAQWDKITNNLWTWYYASTYGARGASLYSGIQRNVRDVRIMKRVGLEGMFWEIDVSNRSGLALYDLRLWLVLKLWNDPSLDHTKLIKEFCDFYYGKAADDMIRYINELDQNLEKYPGMLLWHAMAPVAAEDQLLRWIALFDSMEKKTKDNPRHLENVKHARIPLDLACLSRYRDLIKKKKNILPAPDVLHKKILKNLTTSVMRRIPNDTYLSNYTMRPIKGAAANALITATIEPKELPATFKKYTKNQIRRYFPKGGSWTLKDHPDAGFGRAITANKKITGEIPFTCGVYDSNGRKFLINRSISKAEMVVDKFHYYKLGETTAPGITACIFWSSRNWNANISLGSLGIGGLDRGDQQFEIWAEIKFEGKKYSSKSKAKTDRVWLGEVVVIRK